MREALLNNLKGFDENKLKNTIESGIESKEETILVGLGVLFERYYLSLNNEQKNNFISSLTKLI